MAGLRPGASRGGGKGSSWTTVPQVYPGGRWSFVTHVPPKAGIPFNPVGSGVDRLKLTQVFAVAPGFSVQ